MAIPSRVQVEPVEPLHRLKEPVFAVRDGNEPFVLVLAMDELLTIAEFGERYPDGIVIHLDDVEMKLER